MNTPSLLPPLVMIWFAVGVLTAWVAAQKRKPIFTWFLAGVLFGPLALVAILVPSRVSPTVPAGWSYLILLAIGGIVLWLGWKVMYAS